MLIWLFPVAIAMVDFSSWRILKKMQYGNCIFWAIYYLFNVALAVAFAIAS